MVDSSKWTDAEKWSAAALQREPGEWTPSCLDPEDVLQAAKTDGKQKMTVASARHLTSCAYCRRAFAETRQLLRLSAFSASNTLTLRDGSHILTLDPDGTLHIDWDIPSGMMRDVIALLKKRRVAVSRSLLQPLVGLQGAARGNASEVRSSTRSRGSSKEISFALLYPVGTLLLEDRPTFRWQSLAEAGKYHLAIIEDGPSLRVIAEDQITEARWTPSMPLPRGAVLKWEVSALDSHGKEITFESAKFRILEASQAIRLENQLQSYAESPLVRGLLAAKAGVLDRAEQAFQELEQANPGNPVAHDLLRSVQALRSSQPGPT